MAAPKFPEHPARGGRGYGPAATTAKPAKDWLDQMLDVKPRSPEAVAQHEHDKVAVAAMRAKLAAERSSIATNLLKEVSKTKKKRTL